MSNTLLALLGGDPRHRQLVEKLIERTNAGTLRWTRTPSTYETILKNGTRIGFVIASSPIAQLLSHLSGSTGWAQFSVRQNDGTEILTVEGSTLPASAASLPDPLRGAISTLFAMVSKKGTDKLDDVLGELDKT